MNLRTEHMEYGEFTELDIQTFSSELMEACGNRKKLWTGNSLREKHYATGER